MKFPALLARYKTHPYFILCEGDNSADFIMDQAIGNLTAEMGEGWDVWIEKAAFRPIGANVPSRHKGRPNSIKELELTKPEKIVMGETGETIFS